MKLYIFNKLNTIFRNLADISDMKSSPSTWVFGIVERCNHCEGCSDLPFGEFYFHRGRKVAMMPVKPANSAGISMQRSEIAG